MPARRGQRLSLNLRHIPRRLQRKLTCRLGGDRDCHMKYVAFGHALGVQLTCRLGGDRDCHLIARG